MKLHIVIPALNEEDAIAAIVERTLAARRQIIDTSPVEAVTVCVVSDGSTDRTAEIARSYSDELEVIAFDYNRGYGAAIMAGWDASDADVLGFLDADGTCDPLFFADLCRALEEEQADVALGSRMSRTSRMPPLRRVGNTLFAWMLSVFSLSRVRDTASGMRVVRRSALDKLMPLPTRLHFTPAMSARAMLRRDVRIVERVMSYAERQGRSKLHPVHDGLRFFAVILQSAFLHRPSRPLGVVASLLVLLVVVMMAGPVGHYLACQRVEEWMIYRFVVSQLALSAAALLWCAGYLGRKAVDVALSDRPALDKRHGLLGAFFASPTFWLVPAILLAVGAGLVARALVEFLGTGRVYEHWSRFMVMSTLWTIAGILLVTKIMDYSLNLLADHVHYLRTGEVPSEELGTTRRSGPPGAAGGDRS